MRRHFIMQNLRSIIMKVSRCYGTKLSVLQNNKGFG